MEKQTKKRTVPRSVSKMVHIKTRADMNLSTTTTTNLITKYSHATVLISVALICLVASELATGDTVSPQPAVISSRAAFLRAQRASRQSQLQSSQPASSSPAPASQSSTSSPGSTNTNTTASPASSSEPTVGSTSTSSTSKPSLAPVPSAVSKKQSLVEPKAINLAASQTANNRSTRTADVFQNGDGLNIFVTNTCEREHMSVNIRTSRPFHGVIHTRNQRQKSVCTVEGNGDTEYNLDISHVLNSQDPNYCGVIKARRESPEDKDLLSVVIAVRVHRNIELSDDKFFLLNCTNRCRRPDCSNPANNKLTLGSPSAGNTNARVIDDEIGGGRERESVTSSTGRPDESATGGGGQPDSLDRSKANEDECTIWKFPWLITLLWCMGILLLAMIISHCIMCSSLVCRCVKTEVEEREPSVYEDDASDDDEDNLYNKKNHPMRIDYDNRDIYKTSNNYEPYNLDEVQSKSRARKGGAGDKSTKSYRNR